MNANANAGRLLFGLAVAAMVGGCAAGAPPSVTKTTSVAYEPDSAPVKKRLLDVYAPVKAGAWPVVVMFPPGDRTESGWSERARKVADLGFVVFVPSWDLSATDDGFLAGNSQGACAVAFARSHAAEYGGDPATMIVFGHSAGANTAALVAFARPEPTAGCLGGTTLGEIDALVTWEGSWVLSSAAPAAGVDPDGWLAADPKVMDALTPWTYLAEHKDLKVVMLVSENPGPVYDRPLPDPQAANAFFAPRDPSGDLRRQLEANGALADGILDLAESQRLLFSVLKAQGNHISLDVLPGSTHMSLSDAGWEVFLAAFRKAATND